MLVTPSIWHGIKVGTRTRDLETLGPETQVLTQSLKMGPQDPHQSLKAGINSFFSEHFIFFYLFIFLSFLIRYKKISTVSNRSQ